MKIKLGNSNINTLNEFIKDTENFTFVDQLPYIKQNKIIVPFDCLLILDGDTNLDDDYITLIKYNKTPILGIPRLKKHKQALILSKYNINHPITFKTLNNGDSINRLANLLVDIDDETMLYIKYEQGARGLGQMRMTKKQLLLFVDEESNLRSKLLSELESNDKHKEDKLTYDEQYQYCEPIVNKETTKDNSYESYKNKIGEFKVNGGNYINLKNSIIQVETPIIEEYRMLWFFNEKPIIIKRDKTISDWQSNACNNSLGSSRVLSSDLYNTLYNDPKFSELLKEINCLAIDMNTPFLSLDIYKTPENEYGILEFQMEFGWSNTADIDSCELVTKINNSIINLYKNI